MNIQNDFGVGKVGDIFTIHFQNLVINQKASLSSRRVYKTSQILLLGASSLEQIYAHLERSGVCLGVSYGMQGPQSCIPFIYESNSGGELILSMH